MTIIKCGKCGKISKAEIITVMVAYKCGLCDATNQVLDVSVQEWLGFRYDDFVDLIGKAVDRDEFTDLLATTNNQLLAGRLSGDQVQKLKTVLKESFQSGASIRDMSERIQQEVGAGNLFRLKEDEFVFDKDGQRVLQISAAPRSVMIARSETTRMAALGAKLDYGLGGIESYRWVAAVSARTDAICEELNGQVFPLASSVVPPIHVNCRCSIIPVTELS